MKPRRSLFIASLALCLETWLGMSAGMAATLWETERQACDRLAPRYQAETEVRLDDGSRVDLLSQSEAIEVDWAKHWPEAIGQALYYSIKTGRPASIILLVRSDLDQRFVRRCQAVCDHACITLHVERALRRQELPLAPEPLPYVPTSHARPSPLRYVPALHAPSPRGSFPGLWAGREIGRAHV